MGLFDYLSAAGRRRRFARQVIARVTALGWDRHIAFNAPEFLLELGPELPVAFLEEAYQAWRGQPRADRELFLDDVAAFVLEHTEQPTLEEAASLLVPIIRPGAIPFVMQCDQPSQDPAWRPLCGHLAVRVAIDRPHTRLALTDELLREWGKSFDQLLARALENLRQRSSSACERDSGGFYFCVAGDGNDSARLLTPEVFEGLDLLGLPVAVPAANDCLVVAGSDDHAALEAMARFVAENCGGHDNAYAPLILEHGEWRLFEPPPELRFTRELLVRQTLHDYRDQYFVLLERLERAGRHAEIADMTLIETNEGLRSVALWTEPDCLLPRADFVVIRMGSRCGFARAWADLESVVPNLPLEPNTATPFHLVEGWPAEAALDELEGAPEPDWARGKVVGVANGRLTLFG